MGKIGRVLSAQVEKDGAYIKAVQAMGAVADAIVKSNNTLDLYEEYFDRL